MSETSKEGRAETIIHSLASKVEGKGIVRTYVYNLTKNVETLRNRCPPHQWSVSLNAESNRLVGLNITDVNTVEGTGRKENDFIVYLDEKHPDSEELQDRILLDKFDGVKVETKKPKDGSKTAYITVEDSVDEIFEALNEMVENAYDDDINRIVLDFNKLRERNAIVKGVNGRSSGAVSWAELFVLVAKLLQEDKVDNVDFAEVYSHITNLIIQGGLMKLAHVKLF